MRKVPVILLLCLLALSGFHCEKQESAPSTCLKGRLEIKGICMNYTIKVLEGSIDPALINTTWTNPANNTTYENVFGLASVCDFPADIAEGDEFYFTIHNNPNTSCGVCQAFYPTPPKKLHITASKAPCGQFPAGAYIGRKL